MQESILLPAQIWLHLAAAALISYLLGCFNGSILVSNYILKDDVRGHGSKNAGLTNFHRTFGGKITFLVILSDVLKMILAVWIGRLLLGGVFDATLAAFFSGFFVLLGHMFPAMFRFRGGKGVLSGGTLAFLVDWRVAAAVWGVFLLLVLVTRLISLGSICAGILFPVSTWVFLGNRLSYTAFALLCGALIVVLHHGNVARLLRGEERRFTFRKNQRGGDEG